MFDEVRAALTTLEAVVRDFEPKLLDPGDARTMLELFVKGERLCAAGKALTATRARRARRRERHMIERPAGPTPMTPGGGLAPEVAETRVEDPTEP